MVFTSYKQAKYNSRILLLLCSKMSFLFSVKPVTFLFLLFIVVLFMSTQKHYYTTTWYPNNGRSTRREW